MAWLCGSVCVCMYDSCTNFLIYVKKKIHKKKWYEFSQNGYCYLKMDSKVEGDLTSNTVIVTITVLEVKSPSTLLSIFKYVTYMSM